MSKAAIRRWLDQAGTIPAVWAGYRGLNSVGQFIARACGYAYVSTAVARGIAEDARLALQVSPSLTVLAGPFRGMRYPRAESAGSALIPKLLGSYERELHGVIEDLVRQEFSCIVDVGCAEGYYAVGLALRMPHTPVLAFDIDPQAQALCRAMAQLNGVAERVKIAGACDEQTLLGLPLGPKALIMSDCEGYEIELFTVRVAAALARHTVLIEVHDFVDPDMGEKLRRRFAPTHHLEVLESIDDRRKVAGYQNAALEPYDTSMRRRLLAERRGFVMQWFLLTPLSAAGPLPPRA